MGTVLPSGDGDRVSKGGNYLNASNATKTSFEEIASKEVTDLKDLRERLLDPKADQSLLKRDLRSALVRDSQLPIKKDFTIPHAVGLFTLGEIANHSNKPALGQWLNNLAEQLAYGSNETAYPELDALHKPKT